MYPPLAPQIPAPGPLAWNDGLGELETGEALGFGGGAASPAWAASDAYASHYPAPDADLGTAALEAGAGTGDAGNLFSGIGQWFDGLFSALQAAFGGGSAATATGEQTAFSSATVSSTGDPHLAVSGTLSDGSSVALKYDDMGAQQTLLSSDSLFGGYNLATTVTAPSASGVTYNESATVTTAFGQSQATFDASGNATIVQNGEAVAIAPGQTLDLGAGEVVVDNGSSLVVTDTNPRGGTITTTIAQNGNGGVDVTATAQNVDLGGTLVGNALGQNQTAAPAVTPSPGVTTPPAYPYTGDAPTAGRPVSTPSATYV